MPEPSRTKRIEALRNRRSYKNAEFFSEYWKLVFSSKTREEALSLAKAVGKPKDIIHYDIFREKTQRDKEQRAYSRRRGAKAVRDLRPIMQPMKKPMVADGGTSDYALGFSSEEDVPRGAVNSSPGDVTPVPSVPAETVPRFASSAGTEFRGKKGQEADERQRTEDALNSMLEASHMEAMYWEAMGADAETARLVAEQAQSTGGMPEGRRVGLTNQIYNTQYPVPGVVRPPPNIPHQQSSFLMRSSSAARPPQSPPGIPWRADENPDIMLHKAVQTPYGPAGGWMPEGYHDNPMAQGLRDLWLEE